MIVDAGEIDAQRELSDFVFAFRNVGKKPLHIVRIRTDCKCAATDDVPKIVRPNARAFITIRYKPGDRIGPFTHRAFVETNDELFPVVLLTIAGHTKQSMLLAPKRLNFGVVVAGTQAHARLIVKQFGDMPLKLTLGEEEPGLQVVATPLRPLTASSELPCHPALDPVKYYLVEARFSARNEELGQSEGILRFSTGIDKTPILSVPYVADVVPRMKTVPSSCFLGLLGQQSSATATVRLTLRTRNSFSIVSVQCSDISLTCRFSKTVSKWMDLEFMVAPRGFLNNVEPHAIVTYRREGCHELETVRIPVYGYAPPQSHDEP